MAALVAGGTFAALLSVILVVAFTTTPLLCESSCSWVLTASAPAFPPTTLAMLVFSMAAILFLSQ